MCAKKNRSILGGSVSARKTQNFRKSKWIIQAPVTLYLSCAPLIFNVLPLKEHFLQNYLPSDCSILHPLKLENVLWLKKWRWSDNVLISGNGELEKLLIVRLFHIIQFWQCQDFGCRLVEYCMIHYLHDTMLLHDTFLLHNSVLLHDTFWVFDYCMISHPWLPLLPLHHMWEASMGGSLSRYSLFILTISISVARVAQPVAALQPGCEKMEREWENGENEEIERRWRKNEEMDREWGNGQRIRKGTENEEMDR